MHTWRSVENRGLCGDTLRMRVPGGWLYLTRECFERDGRPTAVALTFVPYPDQEQLVKDANEQIVEQLNQVEKEPTP